MGLQLIFVVETNKTNGSDWIYIKDTIDHFYKIDPAHVKLSTVYMDGKGNYRKKEREALRLVDVYSKMASNNESKVIYCFDCDDYDIDPNDKKFLSEARMFCRKKGYEFVWFCKDIERVFIGKKVLNNEKKKRATVFKAQKRIRSINHDSLVASDYRENKSNILRVLDSFIPPLSRR